MGEEEEDQIGAELREREEGGSGSCANLGETNIFKNEPVASLSFLFFGENSIFHICLVARQ